MTANTESLQEAVCDPKYLHRQHSSVTFILICFIHSYWLRRGEEKRRCWESGRVSNQQQHCLISLIIIQMRLICFPTSAPSLSVKRFTSEPTASKRDLYQPPPLNPLSAELRLNGPRVPNNKLMNSEVVFFILFFCFACLNSIHCHRRNEIHLKRKPFGSFACKFGPVMERNMTHQFNYCFRIVLPHSINIDSGFSLRGFSSTIPFTSPASAASYGFSVSLSRTFPSFSTWHKRTFTAAASSSILSNFVHLPLFSLPRLPSPQSVHSLFC